MPEGTWSKTLPQEKPHSGAIRDGVQGEGRCKCKRDGER